MGLKSSMRAVVLDVYRMTLRPAFLYVAERWIVYRKIACKGSQIPSGNGYGGFRQLAGYEPIDVSKPRFMLDEKLQVRQLKDFLENPNLRPYVAGVLSADGVVVAYPSMAHSWRGKVFLEALLDDIKNFVQPKFIRDVLRIRFSSAKAMPEAVMLALPQHTNYYHWMTELLPRLMMVDSDAHLRTLPLLVPRNGTPAFVLNSLKLTGYSDRVKLMDDGLYSFERLHIPTLLSPPSHPSPIAVEWLRKKLLRTTNDDATPEKRIYVSRRDAGTRYATNEAAVEQCLQSHGFETVVMNGLSLEQQIETFRSARIIVGLHGAAMTNLIFAKSGGFVLELFLEGWFTNSFYHLSLIRRLNYGFLVCRKDGDGQYVDVEKLEALVTMVLAEASPDPVTVQ